MPAIASSSQSETTRPAAHHHAPLTALSRFLGRQPILDARRRLFGYELFYRAGKSDAFSGDPEQATREIVDHWLMLIPEHNRGAAFVNCTRSALVDGLVTLLPAESTVLEIPPNVDPDPELITSCVALRDKGYRFALDAFMPQPTRAPFVALADFIKIDFQSADFQARREIYAMAAGVHAQLLAEKIETDIQQRIAVAEGCTLFQGYFFSQPILVESRAVPENYFVYLRLLALLRQDPTDLRKLEKLISADASLCYRVLRLANSAIQGHPTFIANIREALLLVGDHAVRRVITVAIAGSLSRRTPALVSMVLARARFCELLAPSLSQDPPSFYLLGMLSLLDVLLDAPLARILQALPVSAEMKSAITGDQSPAGRALALVRSLETCDWQACEQLQLLLKMPEGTIAPLFVEAMRWASAMSSESMSSENIPGENPVL
jgi:EAL and modified HD-GYP domain-containing signal transduction protein